MNAAILFAICVLANATAGEKITTNQNSLALSPTNHADDLVLTNDSEALLQHVIALGNKSSDDSYDTNQTEQVLQKVTAMGGKIKQDNRWMIVRLLNTKENDLILGLSSFVKYSRGKYPTSLVGKTMSQEFVRLADRSPAAGGLRDTKDRFKKEFVNGLCASAFYEKLLRERREARYYGDKLTVFDVGRVLVRWQLKKDKFRVIFTNLHAEDVTQERLGELEKSQEKLMKAPMNQPSVLTNVAPQQKR